MFGTEIPLRLVLIVLTILCLTGMGGAILGLTGPIIAVLALTSGFTAFGALAQWCSYLLILWRSHRLRQNKFIQKRGFRTIMTERKYIEGHLLAGVLVLHETVTWIGVAGILLVISGMVPGTRQGTQKTPADAA